MTHYAAGWNMPGYMPMDPPAVFANPGAAIEYIHEEIVSHYGQALENEDMGIGAARAATDAHANARHITGRVLDLVKGFPVNIYLPPREDLVFWAQPITEGEAADLLHA